MSHRRSELAGLNGLRKQVTEAKEGSLEAWEKGRQRELTWRKERWKGTALWRERGRDGGRQVGGEGEKESDKERARSSVLSGFILFLKAKILGEAQGRFSIEYSSAFLVVSFQGCGLY